MNINVDIQLLTDEQVSLIKEELLSFDDPQAIKDEDYDIEIVLTEAQIKHEVPNRIQISRVCCGACGSDNTYDDEGNIIYD